MRGVKGPTHNPDAVLGFIAIKGNGVFSVRGLQGQPDLKPLTVRQLREAEYRAKRYNDRFLPFIFWREREQLAFCLNADDAAHQVGGDD